MSTQVSVRANTDHDREAGFWRNRLGEAGPAHLARWRVPQGPRRLLGGGGPLPRWKCKQQARELQTARSFREQQPVVSGLQRMAPMLIGRDTGHRPPLPYL